MSTVATLFSAHNFDGRDYPDVWQLPQLPLAPMYREDTVHYSLMGGMAEEQWNTTLPKGGAILCLGPNQRLFTLSMFHQLRCLGILRAALADIYVDEFPTVEGPKLELAQHCMNYLRQMILCHSDVTLEYARTMHGSQITTWETVHTCRDWTLVYEAAEKNYGEHLEVMASRSSM
ncbi:hypothetical protein CERSUDRAFT_63990 [Gelatoporia subvermispora B]|uniref:Uncharacterized protein n=1 Tax=Ceriporiopsis subvermispora (strain B) TaxID=914234 RepID=M2RKT2_CERS8|nr:hypothetical protein CERSUDRAFT_63990 [Gelatoporia subvermispora B]